MWLLLAATSTFVVAASHASGWEVYGPLGAFSALGLAFFRNAYQREANRGDRLEAQITATTGQLTEVTGKFAEFLPRLLAAVEAVEAGNTRRAR